MKKKGILILLLMLMMLLNGGLFGKIVPANPAVTAEPTETTAPQTESGVCTHCDHGKCARCEGKGRVACSECHALRICTVCFGRRGYYIPGYGGVGTGQFIDCWACSGTGRCWSCEGAGYERCPSCLGDRRCPYCGGDYRHP